jgi:hypothetical protein
VRWETPAQREAEVVLPNFPKLTNERLFRSCPVLPGFVAIERLQKY